MGELKATVREHKAEINELQTENKRLKKEVERLESKRKANRSIHGNRARSNVIGDANSRHSNDNTHTAHARGIKVEATAYTSTCSGCTGITASGYDVRSTIYTPEGLRVLAAPKSIPFHTKMRVTLADGTSFVGEVLDRGGAIGPGKLDILVSDEATAYKLGRQAAIVEVLN